MVLKYEPWGHNPGFEWDEHNGSKIWEHGIDAFEVEQCFDMENERFVSPHPKAKSWPEKYGDRYIVRGVTHGGKKLLIAVQYLGGNVIRPITAWEV